MSQETFFNYRGYRWLWINILVLVVLTIVFWTNVPFGGHSGGTVLGYTYGILAALGIFYLMWYGIRKRSYYAHNTTLKSCLAVHIWLGIALVVLVPLHCNFQFGLNVHSLAYYIMVATVISGIWGAVNYVQYAPQVRSHRGGGTSKELLARIDEIQEQINKMASTGGDELLAVLHKLDPGYKPTVWRSMFGKPPQDASKERSAEVMLSIPEDDRAQALKLVGLIDQKYDTFQLLHEEVRVQSWLKLWLYFHVPLAFGCVAALLIHIFSVLYFL